MWPLFQPIRTLEILKLCEISWDLLKKYFHLKSNAVYNSSAKNADNVNFKKIEWRIYVWEGDGDWTVLVVVEMWL